MCSSLCTIVAHNIAQNRLDNFPSCPPDNHHCSGDVCLRERGGRQIVLLDTRKFKGAEDRKGVNQKQWIETYHNMWLSVITPLLKLGIEENADAYFLLLISTANVWRVSVIFAVLSWQMRGSRNISSSS